MRNALQTTFAVVAGVLLVASAFFGAVPGGPSAVGQASAQPVVEACMVGPVMVVVPNVGVCDNPRTEDLKEADALETKKEIYDQASVQKQNNDVLLTSFGNYLDDTESIALMEGKNAYIRALENGTSEPVARNKAIEAVSNYYATKQLNLIASWNTSLTVANSSAATAANTTGVSEDFVAPVLGTQTTLHSVDYDSTRTVTLVNSSTRPVLEIFVDASGDGYSGARTRLSINGVTGYKDSGADVEGAKVKAPNDNYDSVQFVNGSEFASRWSSVQDQNDAVQAELDTFINNTFDSYQQGQINTSELVDPYLGAREYAPENGSNFQSWALRSLTAMGINPPENLSNIGRMNVTTDGVTYTGILMSDENPEGGFTVGSTYNASELGGHQFVALDSGRSEELTGEFTLSSATTADGEEIATNETVRYKNVTYETANTEEFQELQNELDNLTAEVNARQQRLRNTGGGGGFLPGFGGIGLGGVGAPVVLLVAAGGAVLLLGRN